MRVALYARVSKALEQTPETQLLPLRDFAKNSNHVVIGEFVDEISSRDTRPQKEVVLKMLRLNLADGVVFAALDRWGRSITELVLELDEFSKTGKSLISLREGLDYTTAIGKLQANMYAAFADYEREIIRERTLLGLARARSQGKTLGRPRKHPIKSPPVISTSVSLTEGSQ